MATTESFCGRYSTLFADDGRCESVPAGWETLLTTLFDRLANRDVRIFLVKEKYARMRVQYASDDNEVVACIDAAEQLSTRTCTECGSTTDDVVVVAIGGWWQPRCAKHRQPGQAILI